MEGVENYSAAPTDVHESHSDAIASAALDLNGQPTEESAASDTTLTESAMKTEEPASATEPIASGASHAVAVEPSVKTAPAATPTFPSDDAIMSYMREILKSGDLDSLTPGIVRSRLAEHFGVDFSEKKKFISMALRELIEDSEANDAAPASEQEDESEQEEESGAKRKRAAAPAPRKKTKTATAKTTTPKKPAAKKAVKEETEEGEGNGSGEESADEEESKAVAKSTPKKRRNTVVLSAPLSEFFNGQWEMTRGDIQKGIRAYATEKSLKDPSDGRFILLDDTLRKALRLGTQKRLSLFKLGKVVEKNCKDPRFM